MDTQQIAHKISGYCLNQYPDLDWNVSRLNSECTNKTVICGVDFPFKLTLEICLDKKNEVSFDKEKTTCIYVLGYFDIVNTDWVGQFTINLNKEIGFYSYPIAKKKDWILCKKYREVMLGIFNFIVNQIQE